MSLTSTESPSRIADWLGLIRFSHTIFALPFAALATAMAFSAALPSGTMPTFRWRDIVGILFCMVFARSAAMAFNRLADQQIDAGNPRTTGRHLPAGILDRKQVWGFTILCGIGFIASTAIFLPNRVPLFASIPVLAFLCGYSLAKRFTSAAHLWLGVALSLSPICAWLAIRGSESITNPGDLIAPLVLAAVVTSWVTGFDIIYACQDADFDSKSGLHSIPARFGIAGALRIAAMCHIVMLVLLLTLVWAGRASGLGWPFGIVWVIVAGLVVRQHSLVRPEDLDRVNQAFFDTNAAISVTLLVAGVVDCFWI
ncbi:4-hydroxybenzoate octaprenyltransferase [Rubripirellula reticaptiva]|uniref:4-hydroxybenzoate polyprenyltransferase n=1 Tax=Rubripirellula reticaptiva TaxID=2528013 RepID=A0A5C6F5A6_9BACT|nr:4-hydroxybenzoate octaprenyltransferase [Rubripirellula reticaptiva]TWU55266.1 4-hydroxybenzoate octaprenyltransferase [Rubripirellula reticaptiva]